MKDIFSLFWNMNGWVFFLLLLAIADYFDLPEHIKSILTKFKNHQPGNRT
ncbi:hypothetical protein [Lentilactobacillus diolivorans]|nr:hypothetical protein [Lentilactobacillus diolivorans]